MRTQFKQAWIIISLAWQRNFTYRFTILMYRVGEITEILVLILMWSAIYAGGNGTIKGFTLDEMITYVLFGNLCAAAVRNFLPSFVSRDINEGRLSMYLVKPIPYLKFIFINELGRSFLATFVSLITQILIICFFLDKVVFNTSPLCIILIIGMVSLAFVIELLIGFLVGSIAFWTDEVDGIQATIERVKRFFSGGYFPLTLLPPPFAIASIYMPFSYSFFVPAALYLKKISISQGVHGIIVQIVWILLLALILNIVWQSGLKRYEATGS